VSGAAVENIALDLFAVFQRQRDISAKVKCLLEGSTDFFPAGQLLNPAFQFL
jgi:hypothetical protein